MVRRRAAQLLTCAFCSYRWPPLAPGTVLVSMLCPICGTRIELAPALKPPAPLAGHALPPPAGAAENAPDPGKQLA